MPRNLPSVFYNFKPIRRQMLPVRVPENRIVCSVKLKVDVSPMFSICFVSYLLELEQSRYSVSVLIS